MKPGDVARRVLSHYGQSAAILNKEPLESVSPLFVEVELRLDFIHGQDELRRIEYIVSTVDKSLVRPGYTWELKIEEVNKAGYVRLVRDHIVISPSVGIKDYVHAHNGNTLIFTLTAPGSTKKLTWGGYRYYPRVTFYAHGAVNN